MQQLNEESTLNGHPVGQLALVHTSTKQLGALDKFLSDSVKSGDAWVVMRVTAPTRRVLKQLARTLSTDSVHGGILVHDIWHATTSVDATRPAPVPWWRTMLHWLSSGFVPLQASTHEPSKSLAERTSDKVERILDELAVIGGMMPLCVQGAALVPHLAGDGPLQCNDVLFVKAVLGQPVGERSMQRLWPKADKERADWPSGGCPEPVEFNWGNQDNLGNLLLLYLDYVAHFLLAGCSAHIRIQNHLVGLSLWGPHCVSFSGTTLTQPLSDSVLSLSRPLTLNLSTNRGS